MHREALFWANAWDFDPRSWILVTEPRHVYGLINLDDSVVYVCGSRDIHVDTLLALEAAGFTTLVDAHDLDTFRDPRSALDRVRSSL